MLNYLMKCCDKYILYYVICVDYQLVMKEK